MNRRTRCRRSRRFASKGRVDPLHYDHLDAQRVLPEDHPQRELGPLTSDRAQGMRLLGFIRRAGGTADVQLRLNSSIEPYGERRLLGPRPGPKSMVTVEALELGKLLLAQDKPCYKRSDMSRALLGLHPDVALAVGLIDQYGNLIVPPYKVLCDQMQRVETALGLGWTVVINEGQPDETRIWYDLQWLANLQVKHSIPQRERNKITHIVMDDTDIQGWARWLSGTGEKDAEENDPYVRYLKDSVDDPDATVTAHTKNKHIKRAIRRGLEIGPDGRVIYTKDREARAGYKSANSEGPAGPYKGYVGRIAVACQNVTYRGDPDMVELEDGTSYITALIVDPAGTNPGPAGVKLHEYSRDIAPNITDVTADRGFTMKPGFLRELHKRNVNVFMDYPKTVVNKPKTVHLGKRRHEVYMHCGTILAVDAPPGSLTPPQHLRRRGNEKKLARWYSERARTLRYSPKKYFSGGNIQFRTPSNAGRVTGSPATMQSGSYSAPMLPPSDPQRSSERDTIVADVTQLDQWQRIPYGTPAWHQTYHPARAVVESTISTLKEDGALRHKSCKTMGLAANTLMTLARVVICNLRKTAANRRKNQDNNPSGDGCDRPNGTPPESNPGSGPSSDATTPTRAPP